MSGYVITPQQRQHLACKIVQGSPPCTKFKNQRVLKFSSVSPPFNNFSGKRRPGVFSQTHARCCICCGVAALQQQPTPKTKAKSLCIISIIQGKTQANLPNFGGSLPLVIAGERPQSVQSEALSTCAQHLETAAVDCCSLRSQQSTAFAWMCESVTNVHDGLRGRPKGKRR